MPGRDDTNVKSFWGTIQVSFRAEVGPQGQRHLAAKYTREGEGHARMKKINVSKVCADFHHILCETVVKSTLTLRRNEQVVVQRTGANLTVDFSQCSLSNFYRTFTKNLAFLELLGCACQKIGARHLGGFGSVFQQQEVLEV